MNLNRPLLVLAIGVAVVAPGCLATTDDPLTLEPAPELHTLGGGNGLNGLKSVDYWANINQYVSNLGTASADSTGHLSTTFANANLDTRSKWRFYGYAFKITSPITLTDPWANPWPGHGYDAKQPWPLSPVTTPAQVSQVLAMLTAFMNNNATSIPIALTGAGVTSMDDITEYDLKEALMVVKQEVVNGALVVKPHVWIDKSMAGYCDIDVYKMQRYCEGQMDAACQFVFRPDQETACLAANDGTMVCDGIPAVQTLLRTKDVGTQDGC
jgi:hypothetical protein